MNCPRELSLDWMFSAIRLKVLARSATSPSPSTPSTRTEKSPPPNRWAASVIFWSGSVSRRIRKEVTTLAQSSMMQAEKKKFDPNSSLKAVSRAPEEQRNRYPLHTPCASRVCRTET